MQRHDRADKDFQVSVVALIVLGDCAAEPLQITTDRGFVRLLLASRTDRWAFSVNRRTMKSSWMYIGFSHHSVPSLSNTATRASDAT